MDTDAKSVTLTASELESENKMDLPACEILWNIYIYIAVHTHDVRPTKVELILLS